MKFKSYTYTKRLDQGSFTALIHFCELVISFKAHRL